MFLGLAAVLAGAGCNSGDDTGPGSSNEGFDRSALLRRFADGVATPAFAEAASAAEALAVAADAYAAAATAAGAATDALAVVRDAWRVAMTAWQRAEVLVLGPAAPPGFSPEAVGLRDEIYSWPVVNACGVDQVLTARRYAADDFIATSLVNVYGMDALEYLLFWSGATNQCPPQVDINSGGAWDALGIDELTRRRAAYAAVVATQLAVDTARLADAWRPDRGGFADRLATAGQAGSPYVSQSDALDDVFAALFYVEVITKDLKLAGPLNLTGACSTAPCLGEIETPWADFGAEAIVANLQALAWALRGERTETGAVGFDDWLVFLGRDTLAVALLGDIDAAIAAFETLDKSWSDALSNNLGDVEAAFAALKRVTDTLKGEFSTALTLSIPVDAAGDTD